MRELEQMERQQVVAIAKTWLGTKYHHEGKLKGIGCDCLTLIIAIFQEAGLVGPMTIPHYPFDWHLHNDTERYLNGLLEHSMEVDGPPARLPLPGDVILWKIGRAFSHGALVVEWPMVIHAQVNVGCVLDNAEKAAWLNTVSEGQTNRGKPRLRKFFSYWSK